MDYDVDYNDSMAAATNVPWLPSQLISNSFSRHSTDSGYDSLLSSSVSSSSSRTSILGDVASSSVTAAFVASPPHSQASPNVLLTTPSKKYSTLSTDMSGLYLASIRQQTKAHLSPIRSYFTNYSTGSSSSSSNSPKFDMSPYVTEKSSENSRTSKLLKSPAAAASTVASSSRFSPYKIRQTFTSRLKSEGLLADAPECYHHNNHPQLTTPTEQEFLDMLYKNQHIPADPASLIGRLMGVEHVDMVAELRARSMHNIVDKIMSYIGLADIVRVSAVSREWRQAVRDNTQLERERSKFVKKMREHYRCTKENRRSIDSPSPQEAASTKPRRRSSLGLAALNSSINTSAIRDVSAENPVDMSTFGRTIDLNRLNSNGFRELVVERLSHEPSSSQPVSFERLAQKASNAFSLGVELAQTANACFSSLSSIAASGNQTSKIKSTNFWNFKTSPKKTPTCGLKTASERSSPLSPTHRIDPIGSKKSRKNLKRL